MHHMIRSGTVKNRFPEHGAADQIIDICSTLGDVIKKIIRSKNIIIHNMRSVCHLDHQITIIVCIDVPADTGSLGFPVQPCAQGTVMDIIFFYQYINSCMKFNSRNLISKEFMLYTNIIYLVIANLAEYTPKMPYDPILPAVIYSVAPDNMSADGFFIPSPVEYSFPMLTALHFAS